MTGMDALIQALTGLDPEMTQAIKDIANISIERDRYRKALEAAQAALVQEERRCGRLFDHLQRAFVVVNEALAPDDTRQGEK